MEPVSVALIGAGNRSRTVYAPLLTALQPWVRLVAVCDPVRAHADALAAQLNVTPYYALDALVRDMPMEAALIVTPIESHHAISCMLSHHGVHQLVETTIAATLTQARGMAEAAHASDVVLQVAENFVRLPFDRMARLIDQTGLIGPIKRILCLHDHTGFHNNSRWICLFGSYPTAVQAITHAMPTAPHYEQPHRYHEHEHFRAHFFFFPEDRCVIDQAGNIKSMLGRYPRPGYTELAGARGTIVRQAAPEVRADRSEVRFCSDAALADGAIADQVFPIIHDLQNGAWKQSYVDLPHGRVSYVNPFWQIQPGGFYSAFSNSAIVSEIVDFVETVRGVGSSLYTFDDAVMAMMMEAATRESALQDGARLALPLEGDLESDRQIHATLRARYGCDPLDVDAMIGVSFPQP